MVKTTNLNASLNRIARDGQISAPEINRVTAAVIRDLAQNGDALKIFEKIGENLGKFISKVKTEMGEPTPELRASEAALEKLEDMAEGMVDAVDEWDDFQFGIFGAAMGLAFEDDNISVRDVDALDGLARDLVKNAGADDKIGHRIRSSMSMLEMVLNPSPMGDDSDVVVSATARRKLDKLNTFLARTVANEIGPNATGGTVDPTGDFAKTAGSVASGGGGMGAGMALIFMPMLVEREIAIYDSAGLTGQAKHKLDTQAEARGGVLLDYIANLPGDPEDKEAMQTMVYRLTSGHYLPPASRDEFQSHLDGATEDELRGALEGIDRQADMWGSLTGRTGDNMKAATAEGRALIEGELAQRAANVPPAPAAPSGPGAPSNVLGFALPDALARSAKEERSEVGLQLQELADARAAGQAPADRQFIEAYATAVDALFFGGESQMFENGELKKPAPENKDDLLEMGMALDMARRAAAHGEPEAEAWEMQLNQILKDTGRFGSGDVNAEDVYFAAMAEFPIQ
jgi:hypothetical protein